MQRPNVYDSVPPPSFLRYLIRFVFPALLALLCSAPVLASSTAPISSRVTPVEKFSKGLLWKVTPATGASNFLFGTIHSDDARVINLPKPVIQALTSSHQFVMEALLTGDALVYMAKTMFFNDGRTLEQVVGKALYQDTRNALVARGLPTHGIEKQKPWAVMMSLSFPKPKTGEYLDLKLQALATRHDMVVTGLETIQEQLAVFDELPLSDQTAMLRATVSIQDDLDKEFERMHQAYLARDLATITAMTREYKIGDQRLHDTVMERLLTQRNRRMVERLQPIFRKGEAFVAVGAAHLPGPEGLLALLHRAGYQISPVY